MIHNQISHLRGSGILPYPLQQKSSFLIRVEKPPSIWKNMNRSLFASFPELILPSRSCNASKYSYSISSPSSGMTTVVQAKLSIMNTLSTWANGIFENELDLLSSFFDFQTALYSIGLSTSHFPFPIDASLLRLRYCRGEVHSVSRTRLADI